MPRLTLLAAALPATHAAVLLTVVGALLSPTVAAADSSEGLTERYIASTFRAMALTANESPSADAAATVLSTMIDDDMAVDETARFVLGRDWPTGNPHAGARFRQQFLHFVSNALASALRAHREVVLRVDRSWASEGRIMVESALVMQDGKALPLTWIVRREGPKGRRRIEDFGLAGIDAQIFLRGLAGMALEQDRGNLDAVIAMFERIAARMTAASQQSAAARDGPTPP